MPLKNFVSAIILLTGLSFLTGCEFPEQKSVPPTRLEFRASSPLEPIILTLTADDPTDLTGAEIDLLLPGDVTVTRLVAGQGEGFSIVAFGQFRSGTLIVTPKETKQRPPVYRLRTGPAAFSSSAAATGTACSAVFARQHIGGLVILLLSTPNPYTVNLANLGSLTFRYGPPQAVSSRPHLPGAIPTLHLGGGSRIDVDFTGMLCDAYSMQVNVWDTEGGSRPVLRAFDAAGVPLCVTVGQPPCPQNPPQRQWASETLQTTRPATKAIVECEEANVSSFVLQ
jgi:hypothetical protein